MAELELNGARCKSVLLQVGEVGAWIADVELASADAPPVAGTSAALQIGALTLVGSVVSSGLFVVKNTARIVGGAGGWRQTVPAQHYHNDAGIRPSHVINTTAATVGETVTGPAPSALGLDRVDYFRNLGPARNVLDDLAPAWWVGYDGTTRLLARPSSTPAATLELKDFYPLERRATFQLEQLTDIDIGMTISDRLDVPRVVRSLTYYAANNVAPTVFAWLL